MNWPVGFEGGLMPGGFLRFLERCEYFHAEHPLLAALAALAYIAGIFYLMFWLYRSLRTPATECA